MRSDEAPQGGERFLLDAADLYLRDADHPCHALLRQAVEIAKVDDRPLARRHGKTTVLINRIANLISFGCAYDSAEIPDYVTDADVLFLYRAERP